MWLAWRLWAKALVRRLTSIFLIAYFVVPSLRGSDFGLSVLAGGVFLLIAQRPTSKTDPRDAIVPSLIAGFAVGCTIAGLIRIGVLVSRVQEHLAIMDARAFGGLLIGAIGPVVWVPLVVWCIAAAVGRRVQRVTIITAAVVLAMATHTLAFTVPRSRTYRETQIPYGRDLQFVREYSRGSTRCSPANRLRRDLGGYRFRLVRAESTKLLSPHSVVGRCLQP